MHKKKCPRCGLVNADTDDTCRRCSANLTAGSGAASETGPEPVKKRSIGKRLLWILGATLFLLFAFYMSLRVTSQDLGYDQRQIVARSVAILEQKGFGKEATVLSTFTSYRSTDNWWNRYVGHRDAYAATNFPFEVMTLYPEFFDHSADDVERAVILLHEAQHLFGSNEAEALEHVWRIKQRLGWTEERYGQTRVWINTKELTMNLVPELFKCGPEGTSDCVP
jgi:hypothetical protein